MTLRARLLPLLPAAALGLHAALSGNFHSGARAWPALWGWMAIALLAALGAGRLFDPLRLGRYAVVPWLGWLLLAASASMSPVPRAGSSAFLLAPLVLLLPAGVAACWRTPEARRAGLISVGALVLGVSVWAIGDFVVAGSARAAMPLGHHNLLALWLLLTWPLVAAARQGGRRWPVAAVVSAAWAALVMTGSLAAATGLGAQMLAVGVGWRGRLRRGPGGRAGRLGLIAVAATMLLLLTSQAPRIVSVLLGRDPSAVVRLGYLGAALDAWRERPLVGWGPGSSSWTLSEHLTPSPPFTPPHQVVSDLHSLPLEILYELGSLGVAAVLATLAAFVMSRWRDWGTLLRGEALPGACALGLVGLAAAAPLAGLFDVLALYVAAAVAVGGVLGSSNAPWPRSPPLLGWGLIVICLGLWSPRPLAHLEYGRYVAAIASGVAPRSEPAAASIRRAVALDPQHPLYRSLLADGALSASEAMEEAGRAAWTARGLSALWIREALAATSLDPPRARRALETACDLDPLGGFAPFLLLQLEPDGPLASERGARSLLGEPRLSAALFWSGREELLSAAVGHLVSEVAIEPGWREAADRELRWNAATTGPTLDLSLEIDRTGETSLSLFAFRRQPLPRQLVAVPLVEEALGRVEMPPYFELIGSSTEMLRQGCRLR